MKKSILVLVTMLVLCLAAHAQYRANQTLYDHRDYVHQIGNPYNPAVAGLTSFLIPGLGQMLSDEVGRGFAFLAGTVAGWTMYYVGAASVVNSANQNSGSIKGRGLMLFGLGGAITVSLWSIVDAVRVAKVNNMAYRAQNKTSLNIHLQPYILPGSALGYEQNLSLGVRLAVGW